LFQGRKHWRGVLGRAEAGWSLALEGAAAGTELKFTLDEVHEARLVPVIDFKGRRRDMSPPAADGRVLDEPRRQATPVAGSSRARATG